MPDLACGAPVDLHSRSRRAGYDPERLFAARVFVAGAGAIGQNLLFDLALAGVGEIMLADLDSFEPHNATRSPLYPEPEERVWLGLTKAKVVAHKLLPKMTAPTPVVRYAVGMIQELGDAPIIAADVVFSAVDNAAARAFLAERCRLHGKPLIEVGFDGPAINLSVYGPDAGEVCWRCHNPGVAGAFSCTRYALTAEEAGIIPAIQNSAAILAGLQAECGIGWLHAEAPLRGKVVVGDIRKATLRALSLTVDPRCPGVHYTGTIAAALPVGATSTLSDLFDAVAQVAGPAAIRLPTELVLRIACTICGDIVDAGCPEWRWLASPCCQICGGPFPRAATGRSPSPIQLLWTDARDDVAALNCGAAGLPAGTAVEVWPRSGADGPLLYRLAGGLDSLMTSLTREGRPRHRE